MSITIPLPLYSLTDTLGMDIKFSPKNSVTEAQIKGHQEKVLQVGPAPCTMWREVWGVVVNDHYLEAVVKFRKSLWGYFSVAEGQITLLLFDGKKLGLTTTKPIPSGEDPYYTVLDVAAKAYLYHNSTHKWTETNVADLVLEGSEVEGVAEPVERPQPEA